MPRPSSSNKINDSTSPRIVELDEVKEIERGAKEVWIYTPSMFIEETFKEIILTNLKKPGSYKYILPNLEKVKKNLKRLRNYLEENGADLKRLKTHFLKECCVLNTIAVYDPNDGGNSSVIVSLPLSAKTIFPTNQAFLLEHPEQVDFYTDLLIGLSKYSCGECKAKLLNLFKFLPLPNMLKFLMPHLNKWLPNDNNKK